jgi:hypothetical protein
MILSKFSVRKCGWSVICTFCASWNSIAKTKKKRGWPDVVFGGCGPEASFAPASTSISFGDCNLSINAPTSQSLSSFIRLCIHDDNTYCQTEVVVRRHQECRGSFGSTHTLQCQRLCLLRKNQLRWMVIYLQRAALNRGRVKQEFPCPGLQAGPC